MPQEKYAAGEVCRTQRQGDEAETATKFACRLQFGLQYLSA